MADKSLDQGSSGEDIRYDHKWGFTDTYFKVNPDKTVTVTGSRYALSGTVMHEFLPFVEEMLDITIDHNNLMPEVRNKPVHPARLNDAFYQAVQTQLSPDKVSIEDRQRLIHSHGQTTADEVYKVLYGALDRVVDMVLFPESQEDVERIIKLAGEHDVCLVPYGGGTSVSCALQLPENETRSIAAVDMRRMDKILWVNCTRISVLAYRQASLARIWKSGWSGLATPAATNRTVWSCLRWVAGLPPMPAA